ncbi:MAG: tetratricopeptide repeat protein [Phototrophicaceae bacterium]
MTRNRILMLCCLMLMLTFPLTLTFAQDDPRLSEAEALIEQGDFDGALALYDSILTEAPNNTEALLGKGNVLVYLARADEAEQIANRVLGLQITNSDAYSLRGLAAFAQGDVELAERAFLAAVQYDAKNADAYELLGDFYAATDRVERALEVYSEAHTLAPDNGDIFYKIGQIHASQGDFESALEAFSAAIAIDPLPEYYYARANIHSAMGDDAAAVADMDIVIAADPELPEAYLNRGFYAFAAGDLEQASVDYYEWVIRSEVQRFDRDPAEDGDRFRLDIDTGYVYAIPLTVTEPTLLSVTVVPIAGEIDPVLVILDADGNPIMVDDDSGGFLAVALQDYPLPTTGTFTLLISHAGGGSVGEVGVEITFGANVGNA